MISWRRRELVAIQVEVTSRCTRRCAVCPRSVLAAGWRDGDLGEAAWGAIVPGLRLARHVHLQGWGEPLLHPRLPAMAAAAKAAGCEVGITTNGDLLDDAIDWILELGVDVVTVSVAGTGRSAAHRGGRSFAGAVAGAGELARRAGRRARPRVQLSYMLTRDNLHELEEAVTAAAAGGIREVFAVHLDYTPVAALAALAAFTDDTVLDGVAEAQRAAGRAADALGVRFRPAATAPRDMLVCALDPTRIAFVSWDGRVGPCAYLLPPVDAAARASSPGGGPAGEPVWYGSVPDERLDAILAGAARQRFVAPFRVRLEAEESFAAAAVQAGFGSVAVERVAAADRRRDDVLRSHPFPAACAACHKRRGW